MVNSIAARAAAYIGFKPLWGFKPLRRALAAATLAAPTLAAPLSGCLWEVADVRTPAAEAAPPPGARGPCPSQDFPVFLDAFGESAEVQRGYTHIPLVYGQLDAGQVGTPKEDKTFATRTINSFEGIPIYDSKDGGRILRSKAKRRERGLKVTAEPDGDDIMKAKATVFLPGTKFRLEYHFVNADSCWELVRIDDWTT
jgi:hypothetical protein